MECPSVRTVEKRSSSRAPCGKYRLSAQTLETLGSKPKYGEKAIASDVLTSTMTLENGGHDNQYKTFIKVATLNAHVDKVIWHTNMHVDPSTTYCSLQRVYLARSDPRK